MVFSLVWRFSFFTLATLKRAGRQSYPKCSKGKGTFLKTLECSFSEIIEHLRFSLRGTMGEFLCEKNCSLRYPNPHVSNSRTQRCRSCRPRQSNSNQIKSLKKTNLRCLGDAAEILCKRNMSQFNGLFLWGIFFFPAEENILRLPAFYVC